VALNHGFTYREQIGRTDAGRSVLQHLVSRYAHSPVARWAARLAAGQVEIDGRTARGDELLRPGQHLAWHRSPWNEPDVPLHYDLIHEDGSVLAVAKPSGLPTLPAGGFLEHTLLALVRSRYPEARPLHRLGRFTSGLVLFARTPTAAAALGLAWRQHDVIKDYRALVSGQPDWEVLEIVAPIGPVAHPRLGSVFAASLHGKPSRSTAAVVARREAAALCDVRIATGRPHQIRIHLAWAGHPLVGDPLYAAGGLPLADAPGLPGDGGYLLHAHRLRCAHPDGTGLLELESPPPAVLSA
jgi:23S rRNA pseudouridine1911/1915/1917 synthase